MSDLETWSQASSTRAESIPLPPSGYEELDAMEDEACDVRKPASSLSPT